MATVGSRSALYQYQNHSSSTNGRRASSASGGGSIGVNERRRLSIAPFTTNSPVSSRFSDRHLSVVAEPVRSLSRNEDQFTELIELALQTAQNAVLLDHQRNGAAALEGYSQCCAILAEVIGREMDSDEITRLRQIHDTYTVRMHVLTGELQLDPNHIAPEMPPLPTQADIQEFEDEEDEEEILNTFRQIRVTNPEPEVSKQLRYYEVRPLAVQTSRPPLHRSSSSRDSTRGPPSVRKSTTTTTTNSRTTSFSRTHSQQDSLGSLEQIPTTPLTASFRASSNRDTLSLPEMIDEEEMDDAAFLERITRGFTSDEEILEDETARPSTSSTSSSGQQQFHLKNNLSQSFVFDQIPPMARTESEDFLIPSPETATSTPRPPPSPTRPQHNRARNTSSPLPTSGISTPRPSSAKKNLSISGAQPMFKSLSANNAIPNPDEVIVPGNTDSAPKIKKRPHLIRVVSESTMRQNYGSSRLSAMEVSPGSPPSTGGSILTPGTTTGSSFLTDSPSANLLLQNRDGAVAAEDPPEDPYLRPYWLMRALALSMKNQKGAYLNSRLFVPQGVWALKNVKLKATEEKINNFSAMTMAVRQVLDIDYGNSSILLQVIVSK
jgi:hypothetical protein